MCNILSVIKHEMTALKHPFRRKFNARKKRAMAAVRPKTTAPSSSSSWSSPTPRHATIWRTNNWIEITAWQTTITSEKCFIFFEMLENEKKLDVQRIGMSKESSTFIRLLKSETIFTQKKKNKTGKKARVSFLCLSCLWH